MLVLQPRISTVIDWIRVVVGTSEGIVGMDVEVGGGVAVPVEMGVIEAVKYTPVVSVSVTMVGKIGGGRISGVAVTTPGVREGIGVQTGNG